MTTLTHAQADLLADLLDEEPDFLHERVLDDTERYTAEALEARGLLVLDGWHIARMNRAGCEDALTWPRTGHPVRRASRRGKARDEYRTKFGRER